MGPTIHWIEIRRRHQALVGMGHGIGERLHLPRLALDPNLLGKGELVEMLEPEQQVGELLKGTFHMDPLALNWDRRGRSWSSGSRCLSHNHQQRRHDVPEVR